MLDAGTKTFMLDKNCKKEHVSIDWLKQAHVDSDQPLQLNLPRLRGRPKKETEFSSTYKAHNHASSVPRRESSKG